MLQKLEQLKRIIHEAAPLAVAFSGGVDSSFLLAVARRELGDQCVGITIQSQVHPAWEIQESVDLARSLGARHVLLPMDVFTIEGFAQNLPDRCYACKKALFEAVWAQARKQGCVSLADGTNADDPGDYRPGMKALSELQVISPLLMAGLNKAEIRALSEQYRLPTAQKPSYACMASRIPYHEPITEQKLAMVERAEERIRALGLFTVMRVRHHGAVARVELSEEDIPKAMQPQVRAELIKILTDAGFAYASLDLKGFRSGSLNEVLPKQEI